MDASSTVLPTILSTTTTDLQIAVGLLSLSTGAALIDTDSCPKIFPHKYASIASEDSEPAESDIRLGASYLIPAPDNTNLHAPNGPDSRFKTRAAFHAHIVVRLTPQKPTCFLIHRSGFSKLIHGQTSHHTRRRIVFTCLHHLEGKAHGCKYFVLRYNFYT